MQRNRFPFIYRRLTILQIPPFSAITLLLSSTLVFVNSQFPLCRPHSELLWVVDRYVHYNLQSI